MEAVRRAPPAVDKAMSEYVTVVSVGAVRSEDEQAPRNTPPADPSGFVTVLKIGDTPSPPQAQMKAHQGQPNGLPADSAEDCCVEQVLVYRLPGERLGFGLKFEGGTKAAEFVKRLFIQSCAPDSPASRVRGSWGVLTEGDEVLAIDSVKVTSMTRIDCVRCLKDSNVVIKLQVRHRLSGDDGKTEAPLVISAEKKRTAPPPPPVPPRKGPRKKDLLAPLPPKGFADGDNTQPVNDLPVAQVRTTKIINGDVIHPPDAEVYLDLLSQEQEQEAYCLSESDDTGSSISTVVDRFGSFPTTTTSSFAGSMPSTPTAVQRRIQHTNPFDVDHSPDEELLFERLVSLQAKEHQVAIQPPVNFQDAPLSYADEDVRVVEAAVLTHPAGEKSKPKRRPPPPPPPRTKHLQNPIGETEHKKETDAEGVTSPPGKAIETNNNDYSREDENAKLLPRLVDFVPKSTKSEADGDNDASKVFIEQEQLRHTDSFFLHRRDADADDAEKWSEDDEAYAFGWSTGQPLATIGEADNEDESLQDGDTAPPGHEQRSDSSEEEIVPEEPSEEVDAVDGRTQDISADECEEAREPPEPAPRTTLKAATDVDVDVEASAEDKMDTRQPPDGHEFPDYHQESSATKPAMMPRRGAPLPRAAGKEQPKTNVKNMIAMFSHTEELHVAEKQATNAPKCSFDYEPPKRGSMTDLTAGHDHAHNVRAASDTNLHKRSQSLVDISFSGDRWSQLLDQRRRGLSKLKGLIIPEHPDAAQSISPVPVIDLPEIKSAIDAAHEFRPPSLPPSTAPTRPTHHVRNNSTPCLNLNTPAWSTEVECAKYSPAFKRKTLQVYTKAAKEKENSSSSDEESRLPADAPKSLESITSPTQSDCSFDYASMGSIGSSPSANTRASKAAKSEDESDNDSAVSSSQSSYVSRQSPPASPNHLYDSVANRRLLKAQSVEAINRKNILASAKCRSGQDLNGSPLLIQRKFDEPENDCKEISAVERIVVVNEIVADDTTATPAPTPANENGIAAAEKTKAIDVKVGGPKPARGANLPTAKAKTDNAERFVSKFLSSRNQKAASVTDLRKNFEKASPVAADGVPSLAKTRARHSTASIATNATSSGRPTPSKRNSLSSLPAPTKPAVTLHDKQHIIASTVKSWEDEGVVAADVKVIALRPEIPGGSIGITLAGGTDYETKDITIHKVRNGSVAHRDGRLCKGERVLSINGKSMNGITHAESMAILKEPVSEVIVVTSPPRKDATPPASPARSSESARLVATPAVASSADQTDSNGVASDKPLTVVTLVTEPGSTVSGLGFSVEGGRESPLGDVPLLIKKLFTGGLADKSGMLAVGDELVEIQGVDVTELSRFDAWSLMKKLKPGEVTLKVRR